MLNLKDSIKEILNSDELTQESVNFWCSVEGLKPVDKEFFIKFFSDFSEEGLMSLIMCVSETRIKKSELPDAYQVSLYDWVDDTIDKAGLPIPGNHPQGSKKVGRQIEGDLYRSLKEKIDEYLGTISSGKPQFEVINDVTEIVQNWQKSMEDKISTAFDDLYVRGLVAGIVDAGVMPTIDVADQLAMEFIKNDPDRIGRRIVTFSQDLVEKFRPVISESYTAEGIFDVGHLTSELRKIVPGERYKLERIVRTETASVSNYGRLLGWEKDDDKYFYNYNWNATPDNRSKPISILRMKGNPYTYDEILFLWENQEQLINGKWINDVFNQRCSISRSPRDDEWTGNRFDANQNEFRKTM